MLDNAVIWEWVDSLETVVDLPTVRSPSPLPRPRPTKRARRGYDDANANDHFYDPAFLRTPPGTSSGRTARGQTERSRKRDGNALDNEVGVVGAGATDFSEYPILSVPSKQRRRTPSPTKPSIKTSADLELLEKPVLRQEPPENPSDVLPADIKSLYYAIEDATHQEGIIPKEVREQVSSLLGEHATRPRFFRATDSVGGTSAAEATLSRLRNIIETAKASVELGRHETSWNHLVHTPMLDLVFGPGSHVTVEPAMTATIAKNSIPRLRRSEDSETPQQPSSDRKKVDYVIAANLSDTTLQSLVHTMVLDMGVSGQGTHFNQTEYLPLRFKPIAVTIETKVTSSARDPLLQLGIWIAAWHERMSHFRAFRSQAVRVSAEKRMQLFRTTLVSVPLIMVTSFEWEVYFACDNQSHITLYGPISLGSTRSLLSAYALVASLEAIGHWVRTTFCDSIKSWLLFDET
ncbi:hypothetical protein EKO27_g3510 [Xylaria grammica]|uniref:PD-(D/E)XK nuclease-like domain-containing protein n=1 Tax=Xylaria grammica TaxID=363999 RepID=A0A439DB61_9PEZI|nr:hypothetical protein EKO27_g3510 [Xylaria grammica]